MFGFLPFVLNTDCSKSTLLFSPDIKGIPSISSINNPTGLFFTRNSSPRSVVKSYCHQVSPSLSNCLGLVSSIIIARSSIA